MILRTQINRLRTKITNFTALSGFYKASVYHGITVRKIYKTPKHNPTTLARIGHFTTYTKR